MTKNQLLALPSLTISVSGDLTEINLNQSFAEILEDIRSHADDISYTDESCYHESSTLEVLFCRCMSFLKQLIVELRNRAADGYLLAKKHLADASLELEWCLVNSISDLDEDECSFTDSKGEHHFYLRNPSDAAKELWTINF